MKEEIRQRPALVVAAVVAGCAGLLALVTSSATLAAMAGLASVVAAVLAVGRPAAPDDRTSGTRASGTRAPGTRTAPLAGPVERARPAPHAEPTAIGPVPEVPAVAGPFDSSGLLAQDYLQTALRQRVAVARRALRPLSLLYFEVLELGDASGKRHVDPTAVAEAVAATLREADTAGLVEEHCYGCILEDTGEDGAVWTAERIRRALADVDPGRRFRAGIASYPNHGLDAAELHLRADAALEDARHWARDRIEVATVAQ